MENEETICTAQAVKDAKLEELTREVQENNHFARRIPVVEEQIKVRNYRVVDLGHGGRIYRTFFLLSHNMG